MKIGVAFLGLVLIVACAASEPKAETFASADRLLAGRVAGAPLACVSLRQLDGNRSIASDRILFGTGGLVYVNQLRSSCPSLENGRAMRTDTRIGRLCEGDVISVFDPQTGAGHGACMLGAFIPYRRRAP